MEIRKLKRLLRYGRRSDSVGHNVYGDRPVSSRGDGEDPDLGRTARTCLLASDRFHRTYDCGVSEGPTVCVGLEVPKMAQGLMIP